MNEKKLTFQDFSPETLYQMQFDNPTYFRKIQAASAESELERYRIKMESVDIPELKKMYKERYDDYYKIVESNRKILAEESTKEPPKDH